MSEVNQRNPTEFNYAQLETPIADFLRKKESNMRDIVGKAYTDLGRELYEAQQELAGKNQYDGVFLRWLSYMEYPQRTAYELIDRYKELLRIPQEQVETFEALPVSLSKQISSPSAESTEPKRQAKQAVLDGDIKTRKEYLEIVSRLEQMGQEKNQAEQRTKTLEREIELAEQRESIAQRDADIAKKALEDKENEKVMDNPYADEPYGVKLGMTMYEAMDKLSEWQKEYSWIVTDTTEFKKLVEDDPNFARTFNRLDKFWQQISSAFNSVRDKGTYENESVNNVDIIDAEYTEIL